MLKAGWGLVWRRQRLVWWIYILSVGLAYLATRPLVDTIGPILDNSLAADRLYHSMDLATLAELLSRPDVNLQALVSGAMFAAAVFLVLMILFTGGILKVYSEDRTFTLGEFLGAGGQFFWRFVRLIIFLALVLIPVGLIQAGFHAWSAMLADQFANPAPGVTVNIIGKLLALFLAMSVRLWFDMAEVHAVAEDEYAMRRSLAYTFRLTWRNFKALFWIYLRISLLAAVGTVALGWIWIRFVHHQAVGLTLLLSQVVIFLWILTRLWQRTSETAWYQQCAPANGFAIEPSVPGAGVTMEAPPTPDAPPAEMSM